MMISSVAELITEHEGRKSVPYLDSRGKLSCGVGHCLDTDPLPADVLAQFAARGIDPRIGPWPDDLIDLVFDNDIRDADRACIAIFGAAELAQFSAPRQAAFCDMAFELGHAGLAKFEHMIAAAQLGQWETAAAESLASEWASQVPNRAKMDAALIKTGEWPP
jgi:GH24 family phage-related lysozyme (muramidase)